MADLVAISFQFPPLKLGYIFDHRIGPFHYLYHRYDREERS